MACSHRGQDTGRDHRARSPRTGRDHPGRDRRRPRSPHTDSTAQNIDMSDNRRRNVLCRKSTSIKQNRKKYLDLLSDYIFLTLVTQPKVSVCLVFRQNQTFPSAFYLHNPSCLFVLVGIASPKEGCPDLSTLSDTHYLQARMECMAVYQTENTGTVPRRSRERTEAVFPDYLVF